MPMKTTIAAALFLAAIQTVFAEEHRLGVNLGSSIPDATNDYEAGFLDYSTPFFSPFSITDSIVAVPRLSATLGIIQNDEDYTRRSTIASLGPDLVLTPLLGSHEFIQIGIHPTVMNNYRGKDMGGFYQFTSHFGAGYQITDRASTLLRAQHTSNASLWSDNRGLDLITLAVRYAL